MSTVEDESRVLGAAKWLSSVTQHDIALDCNDTIMLEWL